jgi:hypothetical protein
MARPFEIPMRAIVSPHVSDALNALNVLNALTEAQWLDIPYQLG